MAGGCGQAAVARQQSGIERFGKRDIDRVVGRQIVPQIPNARQEKIMRIPQQRKVREIRKSNAATLAIDIAIRGIAPDHLRDFDIEQMRRVKRLASGEQPILHRLRRRRAEQGFKQG